MKIQFSLKLARLLSAIGILFCVGIGTTFAATGIERILEKPTVQVSTDESADTSGKKTPEITPQSSGSTLSDRKESEIESSGSTKTPRVTPTDKKLKEEINTYIIESYKAQGNKIIKDLSNKLTQTIPNSDDRKIAYEKIQSSLYFRQEQTKNNEKISDTKREILTEFLLHLTKLLEKKITELE